MGPVEDSIAAKYAARSAARFVHPSSRARERHLASAGGIVVRFEGDDAYIVVGCRRRERDVVTWTLPKGTPNAGETREETAIREVGEETGLEVRITAPFESIEYWFAQRGVRIHKTVHYFLMEPIGGDLDRHDREFETVRWISFAEAQHLLTFETERALVARAATQVGEPGRVTSPDAAAQGATAGQGA
jgi:8-oxo-dGTP pyrophosphatase MutT (NUDIX family)